MLDTNAIGSLLRDHLELSDVYQLSEDEHLAFLTKLETITNLLTAVKIDAAAHAEDRGLHTLLGCRSIATLLRSHLRISPAEAKRRSQLVEDLPGVPDTRDALYAGKISSDHAAVIADVIKNIPAEAADDAEETLLDHAPDLTPRELMCVGKRVRSHFDQEGAFKDEQAAVEARSFKMTKNQHGWLVFNGCLPPIEGAMVEEALHAVSKPRPVGGEKDPRTIEQRYADGLCELVTVAMSTHDLPMSGGVRPQVVVTVSWDNLEQETGCGQTDWEGEATASLLRQLTCDAEIIPVVLNGESIPLDYGRSVRTAPPPLRRALALRDKGCAFPGCDRPPAWTEAHHVLHWAEHRGPTDLNNMTLLCSHHHHVIHRGDWKIVFNDDGRPDFIPPTWVDPDQKPRRNIRVDPRLMA
ncbi:HNH endonuclease signature motif containing protein [Allokutzneria sp. NRRL B-24872]|uniref:HNH endonuclease signature motif containing protein n=1 Tax=Allokutzneria sp. NRRL B-24872 TaxID=1137961 RepID=UPI0011782384|nr:HNH endonuclease signature motif containing protein [Allokutzneria sp. NRRL B-24872]